MATEKAPGRVKYENRTRNAYVFDHPDGDIVFGQSIDRDVAEALRTPQTRSPVVVISREQDGKFPEHARTMLDALVKQGKIDRIELAS